ncbi:MAG: SUMF1/EgtB/PvdO family nonheme iron enzyme [Planctomycetes bacterium]|nr:SUMF1/EgtB/PvdO family nonheme iron enzyme [Planctomycetota bacterium]
MASDAGSASEDAKARFARWLERRERGEPAEWDAELAADPAHADELRALHDNWRRVEDVFAGLVTAPAMLASAAREALARNEPPDEATRDALARLAAPHRGTERYEELERIARGGMGVVSRVRDRDLDRELALKTLRSGADGSATSDGRALRRFLLEARTAARLEHPGILPVHDLGVDASGKPFFTMPLVRGKSLADVLRLAREHAEGWSLPRVLEVVLKVCDALAYAHEQGVVHRDLKPSNVLVGRFGETYVTDWGLARWLRGRDARCDDPPSDARAETGAMAAASGARVAGDEPLGDPRAGVRTQVGGRAAAPEARATQLDTGVDSPHDSRAEERTRVAGRDAEPLARASEAETAHGAVLGTVHYMAPEQARGETSEISARSDVYAIGAILYHALSGQMPYAASSEAAALQALRNGPPRPLAELAPDAPAELVSICEKAMARRPTGRYASCAEMAVDLRAYMEGRVVSAHEAGALAELRKWIGRNRVPAFFVLVLCVIAALAGAVNGWIELQRRNQNELLADARALDDLVARAARLWPATPESLPAFEAWVGEAEALEARRGAWERELDALRAKARPGSADTRFEFDDAEARWRHAVLARLVAELQRLASTDPATSTLAEVRGGLDFARDVAQRSLEAPRADWERVRTAVARSPAYGGFDLEPQLGLVPLGPDPESGLQEFAHLATGDVPRRGEDGGLRVGAEHGVVLVLIPGGKARLGSVLPAGPGSEPEERAAGRETDLLARADETPCVEVELAPYFLAKHELTQAQWERITRANPSAHGGEGDALLPVETIAWREAVTTLERVGLELPTEAQWEHAARAGTETRFFCGREVACLAGKVQAGWAADGRPLHAEGGVLTISVERATANGFGLLHGAGNVAEWVQDPYQATLAGPRRPGDGLAVVIGVEDRVVRGGSFLSSPVDLRSAARRVLAPDTRSPEVGVRPARRVVLSPDPRAR